MRPEDIIQKNIVSFLDKALPKDAWYFSCPNGSVLAGNPKQRGMQMNKLKATGLKPGAPDLFVLVRGVLFGFEVKTDKGRLQKTQETAADKLIEAGGIWALVRSIGDVERCLIENGVTLHATVLK